MRAVLARFHHLRRDAVAAIPGDPTGTRVRTWPGRTAVATASPGSPLTWVDRLVGLGPGDADVVAEADGWFTALASTAWEAEVLGDPGPLAAALGAAGLAPARALDVLVGPVPPAPGPAAASAAVGDVGPDDGAAFAAVLLGGFEADPGPGGAEARRTASTAPAPASPSTVGRGRSERGCCPQEAEAVAVATWPALDGVTCCTATVDGHVVGAAALLVLDGVGLLANAAVLPAGRRRGAHAALLSHRARAARGAGADVLVAVADPGGASHRNQRRLGLAPATPVTTWRRPPSPGAGR